jgi:lipoate-protein ligase B
MSPLLATHLGPTAYRDGLALQESLVQARAEGAVGDWVLSPDHPPVLTVGRSPSPGSLRADPELLARHGIEVVEVARGGDITWHGPGQLVGYTIFDLSSRGRDLHKFLRGIEEVLIRALAAFEITAGRSPGRTGVWVRERKIASIGIAVRRWVSYHGFALNVSPDLASFDLIHPCGLRGIEMTSVATLRGDLAPGLELVRERVAHVLADHFGAGDVVWAPASEAWRSARDAVESRTLVAASTSTTA